MADNQHTSSNQSSGGQSGQNQKSQLSWGQPSSAGATQRPVSGGTSASTTAPVSSSRFIGTFIAGLIIGLLIAWAWFDLRGGESGQPSATSTSSSEFTITKTTGQNSGGNTVSGASSSTAGSQTGTTVLGAAITVAGEQKAGNAVTVTSITSSQPVWAVVYSNADRSGQVMGAARFAARKSGIIELVHPIVSGKTYYVGLVADTPTHTYATRVNVPILGDNGAQVMTQFTTK